VVAVSGPPARELIEVWLRGLPQHEAGALTELSIAIRFAMVKAQELPPSLNSKCRDMINTRLEESEHWMLAALRAAVDRNDQARAEEGRAPA
jgi:predicted DNA-binding transcriptional regulator YafY